MSLPNASTRWQIHRWIKFITLKLWTLARQQELFRHPDFNITDKSVWADLGCGTGTFTLALADLLSPGSIIYATDSNNAAMKNIPDTYGNAEIKKLPRNFVTDQLPFPALDGILMANSLHYVNDKPTFIRKISNQLKEKGCFLIVEYDTSIPNNWVPYPQTFFSLQELFSAAGFSSIQKLNSMPSIFGRAMMYAAIIER